jgi:streptomycin 6-kinase
VTHADLPIPPAFERHVRHGLGERGAAWLRDLPALVGDLCREWQLTLGQPFDLSFNFVAPARRADGAEVVFKVGPWGDEVLLEIRALQAYDGRGICRLLEADEARQAMVLERLRPGNMLVEIAREDDDRATRIGGELMRRLWRPASELSDPGAFKPLAEWFTRAFARHRAFYGGPGPFPSAVLERAEALVPELLASAPTEVLLHADFHHYNVLSADRADWLAIDPKGILGDPGYEVGPFLLNPEFGLTPSDLLRRRLDILADELPYDRDRLRDWGIAHAVLSACWSAEDHGTGWRSAIQTAENLIGL